MSHPAKATRNSMGVIFVLTPVWFLQLYSVEPPQCLALRMTEFSFTNNFYSSKE